MKNCPNCQANVSDTAKFCVKCGFNLKKADEKKQKEIFCPECGTGFSGGGFCPECGFDVSGEMSLENDGFDTTWLSGLEESNEDRELSCFEYERHSDGTYTIIGIKDRLALNIKVPNGVVAIAEGVFEDSSLISVTLPEGLLQIGDRAFCGCENLTSINLPKSLMIVGDEAFMDCTLLDIELPKAVRRVGKDALKNTAFDIRRIKAEEKERLEKERIAKEKLKAEEQRAAEEKRKAEERRRAEEKRKAEEKKRQDEENRAIEERKAEIASWYEGSVHTFGTYPQGANGEKAPIEWVVLQRSGDWALVISKYAIDVHKYNESDNDVTWDSCGLRAWLNKDFYESAFTVFEKYKIGAGTQFGGDKNPKYETAGGCETKDRVFVINVADVEAYLTGKDVTVCMPTDYIKEQIAHGGDYKCYWWLRTPGENQKSACCVMPSGEINLEGYGVTCYNVGVRPAMWIAV